MPQNNTQRTCVETWCPEDNLWRLHGIYENGSRALSDALGNLSWRLAPEQYRAITYGEWKYGPVCTDPPQKVTA